MPRSPALPRGSAKALAAAVVMAALAACAPRAGPSTTTEVVPVDLPRNGQIMFGGAESSDIVAARRYLAAVDGSGISRRDAAVSVVRTGFARYRERDYDTAIKLFNQAWLLDHDYGGSYWGFAGIAHRRDDDPATAERMFALALALLPNTARLRVDYGDFLRTLDRFDESVEQLRTALEMDPAVPGAHLGLSLSHLGRGELKPALDHAYRARDANESIARLLIPTLECAIGEVGDSVSPQTPIPPACN